MKQRNYKNRKQKYHAYIDTDCVNQYRIRKFNTEQCKQKLNSVYGVMNNAKG